MKKILGIVLTLVLVISFSMVALAVQPNYSINTTISPNPITVEPGQVVNLTATTIATAQVQYVSDGWSNNVYDVDDANVNGAQSSFVSTAKFSSPTQGIYNVTYSITVSHGNDDYSDSDEAVITVEEVTQPIIVEVQAAPAIAARLLKEHNVGGKLIGEYVSKVAREMGSKDEDENGSWFHGINKCIQVEGVDTLNPDYESEVNDYLIKIGAYIG